MSTPFGEAYAAAYDSLYGEKDYAGECAMLERAFAEGAGRPVNSVLDLGCGTGNHALLLAARGYRVTGVDRAAAMLARARAKAAAAGAAAPRFVEADIRNVSLGERFDAAVLMFNVLGYLTGDDDVAAVLAAARRHLAPGGVLVCDFWYGPAVLRNPPADRHLVIEEDGARLIRLARGSLDHRRQLCEIAFRLWRAEGGRLTEDCAERHVVRYFFPREIGLLFRAAGLSLARLGAFPDFARAPAADGPWSAVAIARAGDEAEAQGDGR